MAAILCFSDKLEREFRIFRWVPSSIWMMRAATFPPLVRPAVIIADAARVPAACLPREVPESSQSMPHEGGGSSYFM